MNSYVRFRLALTEDSPLIKAYEESLWAELPDAKNCTHQLFAQPSRSLACTLGPALGIDD